MYPLTLNGLRLACNQSTNRDPVVDYDDAVLRNALHRLERRGFARLASGRGAAPPKYRHLLAEALPLTRDEHAILCVLLLRGAQTPGELKQRAERMHTFSGLDVVHDSTRAPGGARARCMPEAPCGPEGGALHPAARGPRGTQGSNWRDLESARATPGAGIRSPGEWVGRELRSAPPAAGSAPPADLVAAFAGLQERVANLEREVTQLRATLDKARDTDETIVRAGNGPGAAVPNQPAQDWS